MDYAVITICLNAAATLERTVASVFAQQPPPREYVFVDGRSTDGTLDLLAKLRETAPKDCTVKIIHQPPPGTDIAGIPNAWNLGLEALESDSELVVLLNADDWLDDNAFASISAEFASQPETELLLSPIRIHDDQGKTRLQHPRKLWLFPFLMPVMHPGCFVRRSVYNRIGTFDERYKISADYDFMYRCRKAGLRFRNFPDAVVNMQDGGLARQSLPLARRETRAIARRHCRIPGLPDLAFLLRKLLGR